MHNFNITVKSEKSLNVFTKIQKNNPDTQLLNGAEVILSLDRGMQPQVAFFKCITFKRKTSKENKH